MIFAKTVTDLQNVVTFWSILPSRYGSRSNLTPLSWPGVRHEKRSWAFEVAVTVSYLAHVKTDDVNDNGYRYRFPMSPSVKRTAPTTSVTVFPMYAVIKRTTDNRLPSVSRVAHLALRSKLRITDVDTDDSSQLTSIKFHVFLQAEAYSAPVAIAIILERIQPSRIPTKPTLAIDTCQTATVETEHRLRDGERRPAAPVRQARTAHTCRLRQLVAPLPHRRRQPHIGWHDLTKITAVYLRISPRLDNARKPTDQVLYRRL